MAKDQFYRSKPHVNVGTLIQMEELGVSSLGARQIALRQAITDPDDRALTDEILGEVGRTSAPGKEVKYYTITLTRARATVLVRNFVVARKLSHLQELGFSDLGAHQIATRQIVTDPHDRDLVAEIVTAAVPQLMRVCSRNDTIG